MNTKRNQTCKKWQWVRTMSVLIGLVLLVSSASAQTQRKPKGPKPPSYDEVMQRALEEKKAATNAPARAPVVSRVEQPVPGSPVAQPAAKPVVPQASPTIEVKPLSPPAVAIPTTTATPPPKVELAPRPAASTVTSPTPAPAPAADAEPAKTARPRTKGPVFSPLPPDLAPTNEATSSRLVPARSVPAGSTNAMDALDDKHRLAIGDRLSFRIVEDQEDPKSLTVMDSGELELPYLGRFPATGKSCQQLARAIKVELEKKYYRHATVIIAVDLMTRSRGKIYIVGPVRVPGPMDIPSDEDLTLSKAIMHAGNFTDFADKKNVKVTRKREDGGDQTFTVNVGEIIEKGRTELDLPLQSGDVIYVSERLIRF